MIPELTSRRKRIILVGFAAAVMVFALVLGSQVQATGRLFQTIPTATPRTIPVPTSDGTSPGLGEGAASGTGLVVRQVMTPQDVMPGQTVSIQVMVTNTMEEDAVNVLLLDGLDPALQPVSVKATQGAARVEGQSVLIDVGTMEAGQSILAIIETRVEPLSRNGQIILNQATVEYAGGQADSEVAAVGLPPTDLPATGRNRRAP